MDLWKRLLEAMKPHQVEFIWVKGHNGHEMNERCDVLATTAADGNDLIDDVIQNYQNTRSNKWEQLKRRHVTE